MPPLAHNKRESSTVWRWLVCGGVAGATKVGGNKDGGKWSHALFKGCPPSSDNLRAEERQGAYSGRWEDLRGEEGGNGWGWQGWRGRHIMEDRAVLCANRKAGIVWGERRGGAGLELLSEPHLWFCSFNPAWTSQWRQSRETKRYFTVKQPPSNWNVAVIALCTRKPKYINGCTVAHSDCSWCSPALAADI